MINIHSHLEWVPAGVRASLSYLNLHLDRGQLLRDASPWQRQPEWAAIGCWGGRERGLPVCRVEVFAEERPSRLQMVQCLKPGTVTSHNRGHPPYAATTDPGLSPVTTGDIQHTLPPLTQDICPSLVGWCSIYRKLTTFAVCKTTVAFLTTVLQLVGSTD